MRGTLPTAEATEKIASWRGVISSKAQEGAYEDKTYNMYKSHPLTANECSRYAN